MHIQLIMLMALFLPFQLGFTYVRPTPTLPGIVDPLTASDTITYSLLMLTQPRLFEIDSNNLPVPSLVRSFSVSHDQRAYTLILNDGASVNAADVQRTLQRAIKAKSHPIGSNLGILGVTVKGPLKLEVVVKKPDPDLPYKLAHVTLSILKDGNKHRELNGLYSEVIKQDDLSLRLKKNPRSREKGLPDYVEYRLASLAGAVAGIESNTFYDLFLYQPSSDQIRDLKQAVIDTVFFPRTFAFFINSRRLSEDRSRRAIIASLDRNKLVESCYHRERIATSLIPPGFRGHLEKPVQTDHKKFPLDRKLRVLIPEGVPNIECAIAHVQQMLPKANVLRVPFDQVIKEWKENEADMYFGYIEGESDTSFIHHFLSKSEFPLGLSDRAVDRAIKKYTNADSVPEKLREAKIVSEMIESRNTYVPVFYPIYYAVYSKRLRKPNFGVRPPYLIPMAELGEQND